MDTFSSKIVKWFQKYRSAHFSGIAKAFLKLGITANIMTLFSFLSGLISIYFLFDNNSLFILFAALHLAGDFFDGIIARLQYKEKNENYFGRLFDHVINDGGILILVTVKIGRYLQDYFAYLAAVLLLLALLIYWQSNFLAPMIYVRSLILLFILLFILITATKNFFLVVSYLTVAVCSAYTLALQLQFLLKKNFKN